MSMMFIRLDDPSGKNKQIVSSHQVWDAEKFLQSQIEQHSGKKDPAEFRTVSVVTEADYRQHKCWKGYES